MTVLFFSFSFSCLEWHLHLHTHRDLLFQVRTFEDRDSPTWRWWATFEHSPPTFYTHTPPFYMCGGEEGEKGKKEENTRFCPCVPDSIVSLSFSAATPPGRALHDLPPFTTTPPHFVAGSDILWWMHCSMHSLCFSPYPTPTPDALPGGEWKNQWCCVVCVWAIASGVKESEEGGNSRGLGPWCLFFSPTSFHVFWQDMCVTCAMPFYCVMHSFSCAVLMPIPYIWWWKLMGRTHTHTHAHARMRACTISSLHWGCCAFKSVMIVARWIKMLFSAAVRIGVWHFVSFLIFLLMMIDCLCLGISCVCLEILWYFLSLSLPTSFTSPFYLPFLPLPPPQLAFLFFLYNSFSNGYNS